MKHSLKIFFFFLFLVLLGIVSGIKHSKKHLSDNDMLAPASEEYQFKGVTLENGMQIFLVSDPAAVLAGVAIEVKVGSYSDPDYMPGLAHFIEHTIVMGSKNYPGTNDFYDFIAENGGISNAFTTGEVTDVNYQVNTVALNQSLKILADMYEHPNFPYTTCQLESFSIESEFQLSYNSVADKISGVLLALYDSQSPAGKFSVGNYYTLVKNITESGRNFSEELKRQHQKYYSPHLMTLTVISNDSIDTMEEMVISHFDSFKKKDNLPNNLYAGLPKPLDVNLKSYVQVLGEESDGHTVIVYFQLPSAKKHRHVNPIQYLSYLFEDDGEGSLDAFLRSTGLAYYATASIYEQTSFYSIVAFEIGVPLVGLYRLDYLVRVIFDYIEFLKAEAINEDVYNAYAAAKRISFDFGDLQSEEPMDQASTLAQHITDDGLDHAFTDGKLLSSFNETVLRDTFDQMNPENMVIMLVSSAFAVDPSILNETKRDARTIADPLKEVYSAKAQVKTASKHKTKKSLFTKQAFIERKASRTFKKRTLLDPPDYDAASRTSSHSLQFYALDKYLPLYNATYTYRPIPESFLETVFNPTDRANDEYSYGMPRFRLPNIKDYLVDDLGLICNQTDRTKCKTEFLEDASKKLENVTLNDGSVMWYQMDRSYLVPRLVVSLVLHSPDALESAENYAGFQIFCQMIQSIPASYLSKYIKEDFQTEFGCYGRSAYLFIEGFSDRMAEVIEIVASALAEVGKSSDEFLTHQMIAADDVVQQDSLDAQSRAQVILNNILNANSYMGEELVAAIDDLSYDTWSEKYGGTKSFYYESFAIGNVDQSTAATYVEQLVYALDLELLDKSTIPADPVRLLNNTYAVYREWNSDIKSLDNEIFNYYQVGPRTHRIEAFLRMLNMQFRNEAFDELRNVRQLGYVVNAGYYATSDVMGFTVEIEGPVKNPLELDAQIENFLGEFNNYLNGLTDECFQNIKDAFISSLDASPLTLYDKASAYHQEIVWMSYDFQRNKKLAKAASKFTKEDVAQLYQDIMHNTPNKISIQIWKYDESAPLSTKNLRVGETFAHKKETVYSNLEQFVETI